MKTCEECGVVFGMFNAQGNRRQNMARRRFCGNACMHAAKKFAIKRADKMFWPKVDRSGGPDACWPYHRIDPIGYGRFLKSGPFAFAHRTAWQIAKGSIPAGMDVLHRCDNRRCCNPSHLFLGTHQDNMLDMARKGRNPVAQLTAEQVNEIRGLFGKMRQCDIARMFKVRDGVISKLALGKSYQFVERLDGDR